MFSTKVNEPQKGHQYHYLVEIPCEETIGASVIQRVAVVEIVKTYKDEDPDGFRENWLGWDLKVVAGVWGNFTPGEVFHDGYDVVVSGPESSFWEIE